MCTVSFIPKSDSDFILVSNRDEAPGRATQAPESFNLGGVNCIFPKDEVAGGSWIGISDLSRAVCLLNGAFEPHDPFASYGKSRGLIVRELLHESDSLTYIKATTLDKVEPFTIICLDFKNSIRLLQWVWDGTKKHLKELPIAPKVWSSNQFYSPEAVRKREYWFSSFLEEKTEPELEELLHFHKTAGEGDPHSNLIMDKGFVKTKSISAIQKLEQQTKFYYQEVPAGSLVVNEL